MVWHVVVAFAFLGSVLDSTQGPKPPTTAELLREAREGNRAAIAAIRTLACRVHKEVIHESELGAAATVEHMYGVEYWRDGSAFRIRVSYVTQSGQSTGQVTDNVYRDGTLLGVTILKGVQPHLVRSAHQDGADVDVGGDVRSTCLLTHWGPEVVKERTLDALLAGPHELRLVERVREDGRSLIHIELAHQNGVVGLWLDPVLGYLARRTMMIPKAAEDDRHDLRVVEFMRAADGAFLPIRIDHERYHRGALVATVRSVLTDVKFNEPLPADALRLPGIAGTYCYDEIRKTTYLVDEDGNQVGPNTTGQMIGGVFVPDGSEAARAEADRLRERAARLPEPPDVGPTRDDLIVFGAIVGVSGGIALLVLRRSPARK